MTELKLEELTLEQKIGMTIIARGVRDKEDKEFIFEMIKKRALGGIQVNVTPEGMELVKEIKKLADYPILICADMESGFPMSELRIPNQIAISSTDSDEMAYEFARVTAIEAKNAGWNVVWSPVVDFAVEGSQCRNIRCLSDDKETIARFATAMVRGYQEEGMVCSAKHFPSDITSVDDSHITTKTSKRTKEELLKEEIYPYLKLMKDADLSGIMTTHGVYDNIDPYNISTFSKKVVDIIREQGFDGVIFSDSLAMMAIAAKYGFGESVPKAVAAGIDLVLPNYRLSFKESYDYMMEGYKDGIVTDKRLTEAARRVIEAQHKTLKKPSQTQVSQYQKDLISDISKKALCAIKKDGVKTMLSENTKKCFVVLFENEYPHTDLVSLELIIPSWYNYQKAQQRKKEILAAFPDSEVVLISEFPNQKETEETCLAMSQADEVIFFTFCRASSYLASDSLTRRMEYIINAHIDKISAIYHEGNPYELKKFKGADRIFYGAPGGTCGSYAIKALKGEFEPTGKVPVNLD